MPVPVSENALKRSKMVAEAFGLDAAAGVAHGELHKVLDLLGGQQNLAVGRRVANGVGEQVVEDGTDGAAVGLDHGEVGEGAALPRECAFRRLRRNSGRAPR